MTGGLIGVAVWFFCAVTAASEAAEKGRSPLMWFVVSLAIGPLGLILAVLRPGRDQFIEQRALARGVLRPCPGCGQPAWIGAGVCPRCGHRLDGASPAAE
jgi:hypothetical protein